MMHPAVKLTDPERRHAQRHRRTDGQTDRPEYDVDSRSYCVTTESAKNFGPNLSLIAIPKM